MDEFETPNTSWFKKSCWSMRRTSRMWWRSVMRLLLALVSVNFRRELILNPSAFPVWLPWKQKAVLWFGTSSSKPDSKGVLNRREQAVSAYVVEEVPHIEDEPAETGHASAYTKSWGDIHIVNKQTFFILLLVKNRWWIEMASFETNKKNNGRFNCSKQAVY